MDLDEALKAHVQWKMKLSVYLSKPDFSLKASVVGAPNECALGKWLNDGGKKYSDLPEYRDLISSHNNFHKTAADVVRKADTGRSVTEEMVIGTNSEYAAASSAVVRAIMAMKSKVRPV